MFLGKAKKILIIIGLLFSANSFAEGYEVYQNQSNSCDEEYEDKLESNFSNLQEYYKSSKSVQFNYDLKNCYEKVAYKIIDKHYTKESKLMKSKLDAIAKSSYDLNSDIQELNDMCYRKCGSMVNVISSEQTSEIYKKFVENMISVLRFRK